MKVWLTVILTVLMVGMILFVVACSSKEDTPEPPTVPSSSTVEVDFSTFTQASLARPMDRCPDFDTASAVVVIWAALTRVVLALPRLAFVLALTQDPVYDGDLTWRWTFGAADTNNITLTGQVVGDSVTWTMQVTNAELDHFVWYDGRCNRSATGGWWRFYDSALPADSQQVLWIDWTKNPSDTTATLTLANINTTSDDYGDSLGYEVDGSIATAWARDVSSARAGHWNIVWNRTTHIGHITYPEGRDGCWDESFECIDCDSLDLPVY